MEFRLGVRYMDGKYSFWRIESGFSGYPMLNEIKEELISKNKVN